MKTFLPCIGLLVVALCGCMHTVVGGGSDSPSKHYHLWVSSHGASARAYVDKSKKKIWVGIETRDEGNSATLFEQRYVLTGSDIDWSTRWLSDEAVTVDFYDWGDGVSNYNNMKHLAASNHIASFSFALDRTTGKFIQKK
jgi:hypothetical protein